MSVCIDEGNTKQVSNEELSAIQAFLDGVKCEDFAKIGEPR